MSDLAVKRPVAVVMVVFIVVVLGLVSYSKLPLDLYPDMKFPVAAVIASYPGAGSEEVETRVTRPIEESMGTVENLKEIHSYTNAGSSIVICRFNWGTDMNFATLQMREKLDLVKRTLPDEVDNPMVFKMDPSMMPVLQVGITGPQDLAELKKLVEEEFKSAVERIPGVASVSITGGLEREVEVAVDPVKLNGYGLTIAQVVQALRADNFNEPGGELTEGGRVLFVRNTGEFVSLQEIEEIPVGTAGGQTVYLRDVAEVRDTYKDVTQRTRMNGQPSVGLHVLKQSDANTVKVVAAVKEEMDRLVKRLPQGVEVRYAYDQSEFIKRSLASVKRSALEGALLATIVIFLFLRSGRSTLIIFTAIPLSIIATFTLMYFAGIAFNLVSMGGLALGIGRMVDDAIVVLENIYRHRKSGLSLIEAARQGASEVGNAVMAATFTTIAVFLPIVFVEGISAIIFRQMAITVSFAIFSSLLVALTVVPMLSSQFLVVEEKAGGGRLRRILERWGSWLESLNEVYRKVLCWALSHRRAVTGAVVLSLAASLALVPSIGAEFLPKMDAGQIAVDIQMDRGTSLERTGAFVQEVEGVLAGIPEVQTVFSSVGSAGRSSFVSAYQPDIARLQVMLVPRTQRQRSADEVADEVRRLLRELPGAKVKVSSVDPTMAAMRTSSPISIAVRGSDLSVLRDIAERLAGEVRQVEGTREVDTSLSAGYPEVQVKVNRQLAQSYGLTPAQVVQAVKTSLQGQVATRYRTAEDEYDIRVRLRKDAREDLYHLSNLAIAAPSGAVVRLADVASLVTTTGPVQIDRREQDRVVTVTGEIAGRDLRSVTNEIKERAARVQLPPGYSIEFTGSDKEMMESFQSLTMALGLAVLLVYMVMAIQYESLLYPFVIMFTMPTTVIGVVLSLFITGYRFSVPAFIGLIMLAGIVVSNGIVLVDYINTLRRRGVERTQAILTAGPVRLRPILMTALTTILAMLPLAIGIGEGGESQAPLATVVIGGLTVSTFLTLVFIPVVYVYFDDLGQKITARFNRWAAGESSPGSSR